MRTHDEGRRAFLAMVGGFVAAAFWRPRQLQAARLPVPPENVQIVEFSDAGRRTGMVSVPKIVKTEQEWQRQLSRDAFEVTRHAATERPFSGTLLNVHDHGVFRCICCDTAAFDSATKFDSGTGWPSFWQPIARQNVVEATDNSEGMTRTAVACRRCDAHLGHVFDDGPRPTGLRYCMNSVALRFAKAG